MQHLQKQPHMGQDMDTTMIKTILVIEDDTNIGSLLVEALSLETPYNALLATDGFQAIDIVRTIKPCLFITDYCLPYMSGIELYDRLHSTRGLEDVPGIVMSAAYLPEGEIRKRQLVCLHKPFDLDDLLCTIDRLVAC